MKFKSACHIDVSVINSVLASKLCSFTRISLGPANIFRIFRNVIQVLLSYINICAGMPSSLHKFCRDHPRRKFDTSINKRSLHQQHHTGFRNQHAHTSIIFAALTCRRLHAYTYQHTILITSCLVPWCHTTKQVRNSYVARARCRLISFFIHSYSYVNSNIFLLLLPKYCYLLLFYF